MNSKKTLIILIAASILVAAIAGIAFAQYVGAQTNGTNSQTSQGANGANSSPQQAYYPYGSAQNGYPNGYVRGMGMCLRFW